VAAPEILILTGDAAESLEVMYPYQRLLEEGYGVKIAAPSKKKLHFVVHDFEPGYDTYTEKPGYSWDADLAFADVNPADYAALVIPGGRAPEYIRNNADCQRIIQHFFRQDKPVAQICHALEPDVMAAGGEFVNSEAVIDGNMISARAWPDHPAWMREFIKLLRQKAPIQEQRALAR
jgi:protease I